MSLAYYKVWDTRTNGVGRFEGILTEGLCVCERETERVHEGNSQGGTEKEKVKIWEQEYLFIFKFI